MSFGAIAGAVIGGVVASSSSRRASKAQSASAEAASQAELDMYYQSREDATPYRQAGAAGVNRLAELLGLTVDEEQDGNVGDFDAQAYLRANPDVAASQFANDPLRHYIEFGRNEGRQAFYIQPRSTDTTGQPQRSADFGSLLRQFTGKDLESEPGYQFRLGEGNKAVQRAGAAGSGIYSGAQMKALNRFNQDYASGEFTNAFNRDLANKQNTFNMLSGITGTGQVSNNQVSNQGAQTGASIGRNMIGAGNARASGYLAGGNALQGVINQGVSAWNQRPANSGFQSAAWWRGGDGYEGE